MEIGKVPQDVLQKYIIDSLKHKRKEILLTPKIGEDCCAIDFGPYTCILSTDPITGAVNEVGRLAVHISCNDIASCGVEPLALLVTILAPPGTTAEDIGTVMRQISDTAALLNVDVAGGHTEITAAVNRIVINTTAIGRAAGKNFVTTSGAKPGDYIIMTKTAGIEGTAIIANDKREEVASNLGQDILSASVGFMNQISVVKEGIIAGQNGATSMHDVTEGGILGAVWEIAEASGVGFVLEEESIPVAPETRTICDWYGINPLRLISSGCMAITAPDGEKMVDALEGHGVRASIIGRITKEKDKLLRRKDGLVYVEPPGPDELYKVI